jgi:CRP/FNR family transcriptional regulator, anaerobic regulatory protein
MHGEKLKKAFGQYYDAPIEVWQHFESLCEEVHFKKNEIIKRPYQVEKYGYFLIEGSGGVFIWKENNYVCLDLMPENSFFCDHMSLITQEASPIETMALEKMVALRISKKNIDALKQTPMGGFLFLVGAENSFVEKQQQQIDLLLKTAEQRYVDLLHKNPKLIQNTAQKHLASYLGITTQSLSRIKNKITRLAKLS